MRYGLVLVALCMSLACYLLVLDKPYLLGLAGLFVEQPYDFADWWKDSSEHRGYNPVFESWAYWPFLLAWLWASVVVVRSSWAWKHVRVGGLFISLAAAAGWFFLAVYIDGRPKAESSHWFETLVVLGSMAGLVYALRFFSRGSRTATVTYRYT